MAIDHRGLELSAIADVGLLEDRLKVVLDGVGRDTRLIRDLLG
jgi:hypothetical protein